MKQYIIQLGSIGDGLILLPSILALREYTRLELRVFVGLEKTGRLLKYLGLVDECLDRDIDLFRLEVDAEKIVFTRRDMNLNPDIKVIRADETRVEPFWLQYLIQIEDMLCIPHKQQINYPIALRNQHLGNRIGIGFGSGSRKKNWDIDNYLRIAKFLKDKGFEPVFFGGEVERDYPKAIKLIEGQGFEILLFDELIDTLEFCRDLCFFLSNDSGLAHLCSITGLSGLIIYNNWSDIQNWSPIPVIKGQKLFVVLGNSYAITYTQNPIVRQSNIDMNQAGFPDISLVQQILEKALHSSQ